VTAAPSAALLRLAALPVQTLLAGGSPRVFAHLARLDEREAAHRTRARALAADLGARLVRHPLLDAPGRAAASAVRRTLYQGAELTGGDVEALARRTERLLPGDDLTVRLRYQVVGQTALATLRRDTFRMIVAADERLVATAWTLLHASASGRRAAADADPALYRDIAARVAGGEPWHTARMQRRAEHLWRTLTRAATRATPRGWLGHVALLPVHGYGRWDGTVPLPVTEGAAVRVEPPYRHVRLDGAHRLALAPLAWIEAAEVTVWTGGEDPRDPRGEVRVPRTDALDAIVERLAPGPVRAGALVDALAGRDPARRAAVTAHLEALLATGLLRVGTPARPVLTGWRPIDDEPARPPVPPGATVEVYRQTDAALTVAHAGRLTDLVGLALRTMALIDSDELPPRPLLPPDLGTHRRPLLELARECATAGVRVGAWRPHHRDWPAVTDPGSGYARLVAWLDQRMDRHTAGDLDAAALDELGAPAAVPQWPVDAVVRPLRGPGEVCGALELVAPAGLLDAPFVDGLSALHPQLPQVTAYREFLDGISARAGIPLLEVIAPGATARPVYCQRWTGDPHRAGGTYLPLSGITLRVAGGRQVVAEFRGERVWPVRHATRAPAPPWDTVTALLMLASPQPERDHWRPLRYSFDAWPHRSFVPRITVGGQLVVSPAQWRLRSSTLWGPTDGLAERYAALGRLVRRLGMPRLVDVAAGVHEEAVAVDLYGPQGIRVLDRLIRCGAPDLYVRELLADPEHLAVHDEATGAATVAELVLRLPVPALPPVRPRDTAAGAYVR